MGREGDSPNSFGPPNISAGPPICWSTVWPTQYFTDWAIPGTRALFDRAFGQESQGRKAKALPLSLQLSYVVQRILLKAWNLVHMYMTPRDAIVSSLIPCWGGGGAWQPFIEDDYCTLVLVSILARFEHFCFSTLEKCYGAITTRGHGSH
jgi:hypothetical protein